jgi:transposase
MCEKTKQAKKLLKKMPNWQQDYGQKQIYFTDEMRYGTRTASKRRWSRQGRRPICKVKIGYEWGYLFVALCPATADLFACYCSHLDKACFKYFIQEFNTHLQEKAIPSPLLLIGDKATAHQQSLLPDNIHWQSLPTACPELNPVERFFEELRKILANRIFEDKEQIEQCLTFWINEYQKQSEQIIQLTQFTWLNYVS